MFDPGWTQDDLKPIVDTCLAKFGEDRLMFGSNFPVDSLSGDYSKLVESYSAVLEVNSHTKIFGDNAFKFYSI